MKKVLSLVLVCALVMMTSQGSIQAASSFTDIDNVPEKDAIMALHDKGLVNGIGGDLFAPNRPISVAEVMQLFVNVLDLNIDNIRFIKPPLATDYYTNADNDAWYAEAFIIGGVKGIDFEADVMPDKKLTREEFIFHLVKAYENHYNLPMIKVDSKEIKDEESIDILYSGSIQRALTYGFVTLDSDKNIHPKALVTRAEVAQAVYNAMDYIEKHSELVESPFAGVLKTDALSEGVSLHFQVLNNLEEDAKVMYSSGQKFDYTVYDANDKVVYKWSHDKVFTMALVEAFIPADDSLIYTDVWKYEDNDGNRVKAGDYRIDFTTTFYMNEESVEVMDSQMVTVK